MKISNEDKLPEEMRVKLSEKQYRKQLIANNPGNVSGGNYKPKYDTGEEK